MRKYGDRNAPASRADIKHPQRRRQVGAAAKVDHALDEFLGFGARDQDIRGHMKRERKELLFPDQVGDGFVRSRSLDPLAKPAQLVRRQFPIESCIQVDPPTTGCVGQQHLARQSRIVHAAAREKFASPGQKASDRPRSCVGLGTNHQLTALPGAISASVVRTITLLRSALEAASSIPLLSTPRIIRGARLATRIKFFPINCSGV